MESIVWFHGRWFSVNFKECARCHLRHWRASISCAVHRLRQFYRNEKSRPRTELADLYEVVTSFAALRLIFAQNSLPSVSLFDVQCMYPWLAPCLDSMYLAVKAGNPTYSEDEIVDTIILSCMNGMQYPARPLHNRFKALWLCSRIKSESNYCKANQAAIMSKAG